MGALRIAEQVGVSPWGRCTVMPGTALQDAGAGAALVHSPGNGRDVGKSA